MIRKIKLPVESTLTLIFLATASCLNDSAYFEIINISVLTSVISLFQFSVEKA